MTRHFRYRADKLHRVPRVASPRAGCDHTIAVDFIIPFGVPKPKRPKAHCTFYYLKDHTFECEPRLTIDVDLAILLPSGGEERRLREIAAAFPPRLKDAVAFALTESYRSTSPRTAR